MAALPYIQLYVSDYLSDTQHLTTEEHGAYMLLIFSYWQTGKPLKVSRLQTLTRVFNERWPDVKEVLSEFFIESNGEWIHARIEDDLEKVKSKSVKNSAAGKASALARALKKQQEFNERSTNVATNVPTKGATKAQRNANHTDTDTDTDTNNRYTAALPCQNKEIIILPLQGDGHWQFDLYVEDDFINGLAEAYPDINLVSEFKKMRAWLLANPSKQKTKRGINRFINNWLSGAKPEQLNNKTQEQDFVALHTDTDWSKDL